jgi:hypothetical protein
MSQASFDAEGWDRTTFAPFVLHDCRSSQWSDVRLSFSDWGFIKKLAGGDSLDGYYLNGYGVEGLVKAAMHTAGLDPNDEAIDWNSEGDTCHIHFKSFDTALKAAAAAAKMVATRADVLAAVAVAREHGFED